jgi:hypothetical protein
LVAKGQCWLLLAEYAGNHSYSEGELKSIRQVLHTNPYLVMEPTSLLLQLENPNLVTLFNEAI